MSEDAASSFKGKDFTPALDNLEVRQHHARASLNLGGKGLEFGAYDRPLFAPGSFDVSYVDFYSTDELRARAAGDGVRGSAIVDVTYVVKDAGFARHIPARFDFLVASHVIEHIPDLVTWFENAYQVLNRGGRVYLVVPDRRYTFDWCRPVSTLGQILGNYFERRTLPRFDAVFDNLFLFRAVDSKSIWDERQDPSSLDPRFDVPKAIALAKDFYERGDQSIHSHVFSYTSFMEILRHLKDGGLLPFEIVASHDVYRPYNEFYVVLEKAWAGKEEQGRGDLPLPPQ